MGKSRFDAALDGAREVWGAVLASTLTTVAVFVPVAFIREEVGQLFGDIAIAISCAVALSLVVATTVIPSLSAKVLSVAERTARMERVRSLWGAADRFSRWNDRVAGWVYALTGSTARRIAVVVVLTGLAVGLSLVLMPDTEYLPLGNQNFVFGLLLPPPGYNLDEVSGLQEVFTERLAPLWNAEPGSDAAADLPGGGIRSFFFVSLNDLAFMGARSNHPLRVRELIPEFRSANAHIPGSIFVINQRSLFQRGRGEGRNIDVQVTGPDLDRLLALGARVFVGVRQTLPDAQARPIPGLDLGNPEVRVVTHRRRASELGLSNRELGYAVSVLVDGAKASDFKFEGREIDLKIVAEETFARRTHLLEQMPIATPSGQLVTLGSVADIETVSGPTQINHRERQRAITIQVTPPEQTPLEQAMRVIDAEILTPMREDGSLGGLYRASLSGTAEKLTQTWDSLKWTLLLALVLTYLLMAALFESFLYPFVIMISVPMAALGGFLGLATMNLLGTYQPLDTLTMLGFVILIGTVVNNAILIVHQSLNHMRQDGLPHREAIRESVRSRIRPIFMSVGTSVLGMTPLVVFPGAGSELYRGLGSVVVGGLLVSTVFTLLLVPALFSLTLDARAAVIGRLRAAFGRNGRSAAGQTS
jgi:HAE1 family hydrophobic/amphiphilic exporter-1